MSKKTRTKFSKSSVRRAPSAPAKAKTAKTKTKTKAKTIKARTKAKTTKAKTTKAKTTKAKTTTARTRPDQSKSRVVARTAAKTTGGRGASTTMTAAGEGARAPAFRLPRDGGGTVSLSDFAGRKLVLFFYPRVNTPGCTRESADFSRLAEAFARSGTAVLGISADPQRAQEAFRDKHGLKVPLLSDEPHTTLQAYGAWGEKSLYGRTFLGIIRTTVLIGADARIRRVWRHVKVDGHAEEVLAAATAAD